MELPPEIMQLRELLWNLVQDGAQREQAFSAAKSWIVQIALGATIPLGIVLFVIVMVVLLYHPRVNRGSLWLPAFGLFGGTPRFYCHSRPASFCGLFLSSRRRRVASRRSRKSA